MKKIQEYLNNADPQDFIDCMKENLAKHDKKYYCMLSEIYYNDKAHFNQLSNGCKAALIFYLAYVMSREHAQEGIDEFMESL